MGKASAKSSLASGNFLAQGLNLKAIFLDAAGTLFDLAEPVGRVYARLAARHGLELSEQLAESRFRTEFQKLPNPNYTGDGSGEQCERLWWRELVMKVTQHPDNEIFKCFFNELFSYYEKPEAWQLFPDTLPFLKEMEERYCLAVVSNFDARLYPVLEKLGLAGYFKAIVSSADARARKPDSAIFQFALQKLEIDGGEVLHIGDSRTADYEGALNTGLAAFHLKRAQGQTLFDARMKLGNQPAPPPPAKGSRTKGPNEINGSTPAG